MTLNLRICDGGGGDKSPSLLVTDVDLAILMNNPRKMIPYGALLSVFLDDKYVTGGASRLYSGSDVRFYLSGKEVPFKFYTRGSGETLPMCRVEIHQLIYDSCPNFYDHYNEIYDAYDPNDYEPPQPDALKKLLIKIDYHQNEVRRLTGLYNQLFDVLNDA